MAATTANSSADMGMTRSRSLLGGATTSKAMTSPLGRWYCRMLRWVSSRASSMRTPECQDLNDRPLPEGGVFGMRDVDVLAVLQVESADVRWSPEPDASFIHPAPQRPVSAAPDPDGVSAGCARDLGKEPTQVAVPILHVVH